jgi:hypothetical protein
VGVTIVCPAKDEWRTALVITTRPVPVCTFYLVSLSLAGSSYLSARPIALDCIVSALQYSQLYCILQLSCFLVDLCDLMLQSPSIELSSHSRSVDAKADMTAAEWQTYRNSKFNYSMDLPPSWTAKEKAGADALFEDPARKSTNVGVTVAPVRVKVIQDFGTLDTVGTKLLAEEKAKARSRAHTYSCQSCCCLGFYSCGRLCSRLCYWGQRLWPYHCWVASPCAAKCPLCA